MVGKMLGKYRETKVWDEQLRIIHIAHGKDRMRVVSRIHSSCAPNCWWTKVSVKYSKLG